MVIESFIDIQKFKCYSLWSKLTVKIKRSQYFAVNHNIQKLSFRKVSTESSFTRKKLVIAHLSLKSPCILSIQSGMADFQVDPNSILISISINCSKLTLLQEFYYLEWSILLTEVVYLMTDNVIFLPSLLILNCLVILNL